MRPTFTINNSFDVAFRNAVFSAKRSEHAPCVRVPGSNGEHVAGSQPGAPVVFALANAFGLRSRSVLIASRGTFWTGVASTLEAFRGSAFLRHVRDVVCRRAFEQMRWIAAWSVVATMADHETAGVFFVVNPISDPVRSPQKASDFCNAVLIAFVAMAHPRPAIIRASGLYLSPKPSDYLRRQFWKFTILISHAVHSPKSLVNYVVRPAQSLMRLPGRFVCSAL